MIRRTLLVAVSMMGSGLASAQSYGPGMMWSDGWGMHGLVHILWWGLVAFVVVMMLRRNRWHRDRGSRSLDQAHSILRERYARGEIDKTEFEARTGALDASLPLPKDAWRLAVNQNYQDVMKTLMSMVTASLVFPFLLIRNFLGVREGQPIADSLQPSAYWAWGLLSSSVLCCMIFFLASAKFVKVVSGGPEAWTAATFEALRDLSVWGTVVFFLAGLFTLVYFFIHLR